MQHVILLKNLVAAGVDEILVQVSYIGVAKLWESLLKHTEHQK
jgi:hypothetical protein